MHKYLFPFIAFVAVASCRTIRPGEPHLPVSTIDSTPLPDSRIDLPIRIDLDSIFTGLGRKIPVAGGLLQPIAAETIQRGLAELNQRGSTALNQRGLATLNDKIEQYHVKQLVQPYWAKLFQPIKIGDIGYLSMNPSEVQVENVTGSGHQLSAMLGVTARPVFSLRDLGPPTTIPPLPTISNGHASGFSLYVDARIQYNALNDLLKARLENKRMPVGQGGWITIRRAELYGVGNHHLLVRVDFKGRLHADAWVGYRGRLYFTCLPVYDQVSGELYVTELKFDTYTRENLLARAGNLILNSALEVFLKDQIRFNLGTQINGIKSQLNTAINKPIAPKMNLSGEISSLSLLGILPVSDCVIMRFTATGSLAITKY